MNDFIYRPLDTQRFKAAHDAAKRRLNEQRARIASTPPRAPSDTWCGEPIPTDTPQESSTKQD